MASPMQFQYFRLESYVIVQIFGADIQTDYINKKPVPTLTPGQFDGSRARWDSASSLQYTSPDVGLIHFGIGRRLCGMMLRIAHKSRKTP